MAKVCSWCGEKLRFLDVGFDLIEIQGKDYNICSKCNSKLSDYKQGNISLKDIATVKTDILLADYMKQFAPNSDVVKKNEQDEIVVQKIYQEKMQAQQINPLYEDIHQIAGDIRFIKNLIILSIVFGVVLSVIAVFGLL